MVDVPYTFTPGDVARADQVNKNFQTIYSQVNSNTSSILQAENSLSNIQVNKANINGNQNNLFRVKSPVSDYEAVNKVTLEDYISNIKSIINGLNVSIDTGSTNTIIVHKGSCFDSTLQKVMYLTEDISFKNTNQYGDQTYNVYIVSRDNGLTFNVEVSLSEYNDSNILFRKIGKYRTNSSNEIMNNPSSFCYAIYGLNSHGYELNKYAPDYDAGVETVSLTSSTQWIAPCCGWIVTAAATTTWRADGAVPYTLGSFVEAGTVLTATASITLNFLPCKGV